MALRKVCDRGALASGTTLAVTVSDKRVLLVEAGGRLCAYNNWCPHKGVPLSDGALRGTILTCTAHHWTFDATTGRGISPDCAALTPVPFTVIDGGIWIDDGEARDTAPEEEAVGGASRKD